MIPMYARICRINYFFSMNLIFLFFFNVIKKEKKLQAIDFTGIPAGFLGFTCIAGARTGRTCGTGFAGRLCARTAGRFKARTPTGGLTTGFWACI